MICNRKSSCFSNISPETIENLEENRKELTYKAGEIICKQGSFASHISYVNSGMVKTYLETNNNTNIILNIIPQGKLIGLPSLFHNNAFQYSAAAIEDSIICSIDMQFFDRFIGNSCDFARRIINELNANTTAIYDRLISLTQKNLNGRVAYSLLYLAKEVYNSDKFINTLSRKDIAELSGTSPESITRTLSKFKKEKIIKIKNKHLSIENKKLLEQISTLG